MRSEANFPSAFTDPRNLVIGPLVLDGGAETTSAGTVREFGGSKFPVLVKNGHRVTVQISPLARRFAGLYYGAHPEYGPRRFRDSHHTVTFVACHRGQRSGSTVDPSLSAGAPLQRAPGRHGDRHAARGTVTFWSGFVLTRAAVCVPLEVYVDEDRSPRHAVLSFGAHRCRP